MEEGKNIEKNERKYSQTFFFTLYVRDLFGYLRTCMTKINTIFIQVENELSILTTKCLVSMHSISDYASIR